MEVRRGVLWLPIDPRETRTTERADHPAHPGTSCPPCLSQSDQRQRWTQTRSQWTGIRRPGRPCTGSSSRAALKEQGTSLRPNRRSKTARRTEWSLSRQNRCRGTAGQGRHSSQTRGRGGSRWPGGVSRVCRSDQRRLDHYTISCNSQARISIGQN